MLAAPLVSYGPQRLVDFNVLLALAVVCAMCSWRHRRRARRFHVGVLRRRSPPVCAFLMPDIFNLAVILFAYFCARGRVRGSA
jgi:hypothetical protein